MESELDKCLRLYVGNPTLSVITAHSLGLLDEFVTAVLDKEYRSIIHTSENYPPFKDTAKIKIFNATQFKINKIESVILANDSHKNGTEWHTTIYSIGSLMACDANPRQFTKEDCIRVIRPFVMDCIKQYILN